MYWKRDPRLAPAYTFAEAAHLLRLPIQTLRNWSLGRETFSPVFELDDPKRAHLSFWNLVEAHVLTAIRKEHGVRLPKVRRALQYVVDHLGIQRPLIHQKFETDGRSLFVEHYGDLVDASRRGQLVMGELLLARLKRIKWDTRGLPIALYPFTRSQAQTDQPKFVSVDPTVSFGRPAVRGVATSTIWDRYRAGDSSSHLAEDYGLTLDEIEEAIRCEAA